MQACQQQEADKRSVVPLPPFPLSTHLEVSLGEKSCKGEKVFYVVCCSKFADEELK